MWRHWEFLANINKYTTCSWGIPYTDSNFITQAIVWLFYAKFVFSIIVSNYKWYKMCCIVICWFMQKYTHIYWVNTDTMINDASRKTQEEDTGRNDAGRKEDARRIKMQEGRHKKTSSEKYSPLTLLQGFERLACERMLETERKLHILTPLLWPSRCVFIVLLMLGSTPSGLSEGPLGLVWPSLPHLVSNRLGVCWQLLWGFSECPLGRVWPSLPHLVSTVWNSTGNCSGTKTQLS